MRANRSSQTALAVAMVAALIGADRASAAETVLPTATTSTPRRLVVSITDRKLLVIENEKVVSVFQVAVGAAATPSPVGTFIFEVNRNEPSAESIRRTVAASIDRSTLCSVLLQRQGEPAAALVPEWLSGYTALLARGDRGLSRAAVAALPLDQRTLTLRADASDPLAQAIAERIAVDVREAGFTMRVQAPAGLAPRPDVRLVRMTLDATAPDRALAAVMTGLGARFVALATTETAPSPGAPIETVYRIERTLLEHHVVIPVVHVPELYGLGERVEWWNGPAVLPTGAWDLANVWLRTEKPDPR